MENKCENHPLRQATFVCEKYKRYFCEACATCRDPKLYCKFRPMCLINGKQKMDKL